MASRSSSSRRAWLRSFSWVSLKSLLPSPSAAPASSPLPCRQRGLAVLYLSVPVHFDFFATAFLWLEFSVAIFGARILFVASSPCSLFPVCPFAGDSPDWAARLWSRLCPPAVLQTCYATECPLLNHLGWAPRFYALCAVPYATPFPARPPLV